MLYALLVGFVVWIVCMFRKNGFKKSSMKACVASMITFAGLFAAYFTYFMIAGVPNT